MTPEINKTTGSAASKIFAAIFLLYGVMALSGGSFFSFAAFASSAAFAFTLTRHKILTVFGKEDLDKKALGLLLTVLVCLGLITMEPHSSHKTSSPIRAAEVELPAAKPVVQDVSGAPVAIRELSGEVKLVPGHHTFQASVYEDGKVMFSYEPPLPHTDGAMFGAMYDAITSVYGKDAGQYFGAKLTLYPIGAVNALAIEGVEYRYLGIPVKESDENQHVGAMTFWRVAK